MFHSEGIMVFDQLLGQTKRAADARSAVLADPEKCLSIHLAGADVMDDVAAV